MKSGEKANNLQRIRLAAGEILLNEVDRLSDYDYFTCIRLRQMIVGKVTMESMRVRAEVTRHLREMAAEFCKEHAFGYTAVFITEQVAKELPNVDFLHPAYSARCRELRVLWLKWIIDYEREASDKEDSNSAT